MYLGALNATPRDLPSGYTQVAYIQSSGTQYIDTAYKAVSENYRIKCKFTVTNYAANNVLFGGGASTDIISVLLNSETQLKFYVGSGSVSNALSTFASGTEYEMECYANSGTFTVNLNGVSRSGSYSGTINKDYPLFIFANNSSGSAAQFSSIRISEFQIYDNGTLVRDFVPCKNASGTVGLYDLVNSEFYADAAGGNFTAGATVGFVARVTPNWYFGDSNNIARNIIAGYIGDANNLARLFYSSSNLFGDGSDGDAVISSAITLLADTEDTGMIVKNYKSLTITSAGSLTAGNRNCGMIIRVKGNCTIDGSIVNMMAPKTILDSDGVDFSIYPATMKTTLAGAGGNGGGRDSGGQANGQRGYGMSGRFYGGGYSGGGKGGYYDNHAGYGGGSATDITTAVTDIFVGGLFIVGGSRNAAYGGGGRGKDYSSSKPGGAGGNGPGGNGGKPKSSGYGTGGGGAGNYGGGVVILLVGGNLTISSTGKINCNGGKGGNGGDSGSQYSYKAFGGGGGGGGRVFICHKGSITNSGSITVNGGSVGVTSSDRYTGTGETEGTAGGIGTIAIKTYDQYMEEDAE